MAAHWQSDPPTHCDWCEGELKDQFVDGVTRDGRWAILCIPCHKLCGIGLGTGRGQRYSLATLAKLEG